MILLQIVENFSAIFLGAQQGCHILQEQDPPHQGTFGAPKFTEQQKVRNGKDMFYEAAAAIGHAMLGSSRADTLSKLEAMIQLQLKDRKRVEKVHKPPVPAS